MSTTLSRRDFLKLAALSMGSLAFRPVFGLGTEEDTGKVGRVTIYSVSVYTQPDDKSQIVCQRYRDELLHIYYEVISDKGPGYNPKWYRVWRGYVHSAYIQMVETHLNPVLPSVPESGQLMEVTVPLSQSFRYTKWTDWQPVYRLYYQSVHWAVGIDEGPDGKPWYRLKDELLDVDYNVPAADLRPITAEEIAPISPDVPPEEKRVEVSLARQELTAYEGDKVVLHTKIASGIPSDTPGPNGIPTKTPTGTFHVQSKMPSKHMGDGHLTADLQAYELPGVPWVSFFEPKTGVALHGTYWHDNFGIPMSHGCVNMRMDEAKWIFRWVTPVSQVTDWNRIGYGTVVKVT
jgi:lipoprotein-anchoring transpeptidase ErfK/SrfK